MGGEPVVVRHEVRDVVAGDQQFRVQVVPAVEREFVVLSNMALRIQQALHGLADRVELTGRRKQVDGVPECRRRPGLRRRLSTPRSTSAMSSPLPGLNTFRRSCSTYGCWATNSKRRAAMSSGLTVVTDTDRARTPILASARSRAAVASTCQALVIAVRKVEPPKWRDGQRLGVGAPPRSNSAIGRLSGTAGAGAPGAGGGQAERWVGARGGPTGRRGGGGAPCSESKVVAQYGARIDEPTPGGGGPTPGASDGPPPRSPLRITLGRVPSAR